MKLARIRIENFRQLGTSAKPFELSFTDHLDRVRDLTLLVGPNTSGKTTLLDAIAAALGPNLEMPTTRKDFRLSPRSVVRVGERAARVTCWLRFSPDEVVATRDLFRLAEIEQHVPEVKEVEVTWEYPDRRGRSKLGFTSTSPEGAWALFKGRVQTARLLSTGRVDWAWFRRVGSVFTFDQERTGMGKTVSRRVWNIIHGEESEVGSNERRTTDPRTILIDLALRSLVRSDTPHPEGRREFDLIRQRYAQVCQPRQIVGAVENAGGEFDIYFNDGRQEYRYDGLSSGERMTLLLLIRFVSEHMHRSIVLVDELELNQHPIWQRKLLHMLPQMGDDNQIIATTHSPYLRDAVRPDAVIDLGDLGDQPSAGGV